MTKILLSLGSNLGDRAGALSAAVRLLVEKCAIKNLVVSSIYETEPVGFTDQPEYFNIAVCGETALAPEEFFMACKEIEFEIGRKNREKWHEREIDIDILMFGAENISTILVKIPHERMCERRFVLLPSDEIAPEMFHPVLRKTIREILSECEDLAAVVRRDDVKLEIGKR